MNLLKVNGEWISNLDSIRSHVANYFVNLFDKGDTVRETNPIFTYVRSIMDYQAGMLIRRANMEEVRKVVFNMKRFGSPGPDGIQDVFYQKYWGVVGHSITTMVNEALSFGKVPVGILDAYITLIPKKDCPETAGDFRSITLLNVVFKIISKVLVNRIRPLINNLVGSY